MSLLLPFVQSGGFCGPTYIEIQWQQYYAANFMAYHGHAAPAVPRRPAQHRDTTGELNF